MARDVSNDEAMIEMYRRDPKLGSEVLEALLATGDLAAAASCARQIAAAIEAPSTDIEAIRILLASIDLGRIP